MPKGKDTTENPRGHKPISEAWRTDALGTTPSANDREVPQLEDIRRWANSLKIASDLQGDIARCHECVLRAAKSSPFVHPDDTPPPHNEAQIVLDGAIEFLRERYQGMWARTVCFEGVFSALAPPATNSQPEIVELLMILQGAVKAAVLAGTWDSGAVNLILAVATILAKERGGVWGEVYRTGDGTGTNTSPQLIHSDFPPLPEEQPSFWGGDATEKLTRRAWYFARETGQQISWEALGEHFIVPLRVAYGSSEEQYIAAARRLFRDHLAARLVLPDPSYRGQRGLPDYEKQVRLYPKFRAFCAEHPELNPEEKETRNTFIRAIRAKKGSTVDVSDIWSNKPKWESVANCLDAALQWVPPCDVHTLDWYIDKARSVHLFMDQQNG